MYFLYTVIGSWQAQFAISMIAGALLMSIMVMTMMIMATIMAMYNHD